MYDSKGAGVWEIYQWPHLKKNDWLSLMQQLPTANILSKGWGLDTIYPVETGIFVGLIEGFLSEILQVIYKCA